MDNIIHSILDSAGWYQNRNINIDYELEILQREGFALPNDRIIPLLKEFWNMKIEFTLPDGAFSDIELNIETAVESIDLDTLRTYETKVSKQLIPIGALHFRTGLILVSLDVNFYLITSRDIYKVADSFTDFLDVTINRKDIQRIM